jgi:hypothetical protein
LFGVVGVCIPVKHQAIGPDGHLEIANSPTQSALNALFELSQLRWRRNIQGHWSIL